MKKRLVGGLILLNLTAMSLLIDDDDYDITDEGIKSQLLELRNFIDEKRDFTKGAKDLKPVLVQYRSSDSDIDGIVQCNMGFNTDELHLSIGGTVVLSNYRKLTININVEFEHTDYVGYTIKTATIGARTSDYLAVHVENNTGTLYFDNSIEFTVGDNVMILVEDIDAKRVAYGQVLNIDENNNVEIFTTPFIVELADEGNTLAECGKIMIDMVNKEVYLKKSVDETSISTDDNDEIELKIYLR